MMIAAWVIGYVLVAAFFSIFLKRATSLDTEERSLMAIVWPALMPFAICVIVFLGLARMVNVIADKLEGIIK